MTRPSTYLVGFDVGSTSVKAVVVESESDTIVWQDYRRHETHQAEGAPLTLITGVGRAEVTRDQVEAYCARREHDENLAAYYMAHRDIRD